ncbi:MAG: hypothetical protein J6U43_04715, partial [Bacteroidales bacterium]|nr:hypothetical protein [Bacteroidales bacterium]
YYTTMIYDAEHGAYVASKMKKQHSICTYGTGYRVVLQSTTNYVYEDGQEVMTSFVKHYSTNDYSFAADTLFSTDMTTITGLIEYNYYATFNKEYGYLLSQSLVSTKTYRYENGEFILVEEMEQNTNHQTGLITDRQIYFVSDNGSRSLVEATTYTPSKEYGSIKAPATVSYANNVLTWRAPSNPNMVPGGYRVFVNNIPYGDTEETSMEIKNIPTGEFTFTVMALYIGSESSYAVSSSGSYTAPELTYDLPLPTADPANGSKFDSTVGIETITLSFDRDVYAIEGTTLYAENKDKNTRIEATIEAVEGDNSKWTITLSEKAIAEGNYSIVVPAATFGDETAFASIYNNAFAYGMVNAEFTLDYHVATSVEGMENDVVIGVVNRNIIAPADAKVYNVQGIETGKENVAPGIYMVVYQNNVTKVHVR